MRFKVFFVLLLVLSLTACGMGKNELENSFEEMEALDSFRVDTSMDNVPLFGSLTVTMKVDGDLRYSSSILEEDGIYSKMVEGEEYEYIKQSDGSYTLSETPEERDDDEVDDELIDMLDYDDFEKNDDGHWIMTEDRYYMDEAEETYMKDVVIELQDEGYIDTMTFTMYAEGMNIDVEMDFSGYNDTPINVPE